MRECSHDGGDVAAPPLETLRSYDFRYVATLSALRLVGIDML